MIVVSGSMRIGQDSLEAFRDVSRVLVEETLREPGCAAYSFAEDVCEPGRFLIFEEFADDAALEEHVRAEHYRTWGRALRDLEVLEVAVAKYDASGRTVLR
ncbi:antibiotic biosynthesis monooxygenase [Nocardioides anomalus]|uniref:Antibiotic biosynthesis monooxygenase n=1 Tax=Nocardioides anomalus TaxID=2712223 RepID=A0A6G6WEZ6_9ACTN|nr:putative quinol monooxygenase [Nocardioides anomalus]QIG43727.1 antibiotic biosynthesis monooxygenase [Nocardioides anomalus]